MTYKTLMVHLELDSDNTSLLDVAADLANEFDATIIGIAACQPCQVMYDEGFTAGEAMVADWAEIEREIAAAETSFRKALGGRVKNLEWRSAITYEPLASYIATQARAADLLITRPDRGASLLDNTRRVKVGKLAEDAGRPVLTVPHEITRLAPRNALIAWKDCREARRSVADALPLLRLAKHVTVLEVARADDRKGVRGRVEDVARWLKSHGITADAVDAPRNHSVESDLYAEIIERDCDLLVAGAYGHSQLAEFILGGVTRDLLIDPRYYCVLMAH